MNAKDTYSNHSISLTSGMARQIQLVKMVTRIMKSNTWFVIRYTAILLSGFQAGRMKQDGAAEKREMVVV